MSYQQCVERENREMTAEKERTGRRLKACQSRIPFVRPGAAPERGTGPPPLPELERAEYANAGGTAEGLPFVPNKRGGGRFSF